MVRRNRFRRAVLSAAAVSALTKALVDAIPALPNR
jgi:hypothetical protein